MTFRVEVSRDETVMRGGVTIEITAYIDRSPETPKIGHEELLRAPKGVWNSRLLFSGDFAELGAALSAIEQRFPEVDELRCNEFSLDYEIPSEMAPLHRRDGKWQPGKPPQYGPPPQLDWRIG